MVSVCDSIYRKNDDGREDVKMDAKEAINILAKMQNYDSKENVEALEIAISALEKVETLEAENARLKEKETPKEPVKYNNFHRCPSCEEGLLPKQNFCDECGQKLDWSSDKE